MVFATLNIDSIILVVIYICPQIEIKSSSQHMPIGNQKLCENIE